MLKIFSAGDITWMTARMIATMNNGEDKDDRGRGARGQRGSGDFM